MNNTAIRPLVRQYAPPAPLRSFVECFWTLEADGGVMPQVVQADGCVDLICRLSDPVTPLDRTAIRDRMLHGDAANYVLGARLLPVAIALPVGVQLVGVRFRPGGAYPFFRAELDVMTDHSLALADLWSAREERMFSQVANGADWMAIMGRVLCGRLERNPHPHQSVLQALDVVGAHRGRIRIKELAHTVGLSERQLERLFRVQVGVSPKALARIERFRHAQQALIQHPELSLAEIALHAGYADQAHLTREFTTLAGGTSPAQMRSAAMAEIFKTD